MLLPPGVCAAIDAKHRAFLWSGTDRTSGAQCLIAWEEVCELKEDGGLGVKRLETQNAALLLKLINRLHHPGCSAWARWVATQATLHDLGGNLAGAHWTALRQLFPAYQKMTTVTVGDGRNTDFWKDTWLLDAPLADLMPALHSHVTGATTSVHDVVRVGVRNTVQRRLSTQATEELEQVCS